MSESSVERISPRDQIKSWVAHVTPKIENALQLSRHKANLPEGDLYSMNLCDELDKAISEEELKKAGVEGNHLFNVEANGHSAIHVGFYVHDQKLVIDPTSGQWLNPEGDQLTELIKNHPELFKGRILVATPDEIKEKLGWDYKV